MKSASTTSTVPSPLTSPHCTHCGLSDTVGVAAGVAVGAREGRIVLGVLFLLDWYWAGLSFAVLISLRLVALSVAFTVLIATTTRDEMREALERLGLPRRIAFAFASALAALNLLEAEWDGILEAQRARGLMLTPGRGRT